MRHFISKKPYQPQYAPGIGWQVVGPDLTPLEQVYGTLAGATSAAGRKNSEAARLRTKRLCMNCQTEFDSEGPHNRMCNSCRHLGSAEADPCGYSFGAMTGRRRA